MLSCKNRRLIFVLALLLTTSYATAQPTSCAIPGKDGTTLQTATYYAGGSTASAGQPVVSLGAVNTDLRAGSTPVAVGDLVMIIQMQDASYNNSNSVNYGDGSTGRGWTNLNSAGQYEFRRVIEVSGSNLTLDQNLTNTYTNANPTAGTGGAENGNRRYQIIRVPQFSSLTLPGGTVSPPAWNGQSGGVAVLDVANTLNMNGTTIDVSALGFRGAGGVPNFVHTGQSDYAVAVSDLSQNGESCGGTNTGNFNNFGAFKGEGISGTPRYIRRLSGGVNEALAYAFVDLGVSGYAANVDLARGAPGNAGGGGTQHNAGGGGGSNAGQGGIGGVSFAFYNNGGTCTSFSGGNPNPFLACNGDQARAVGGLAGGTLAASISRLILGGGGGAGENNNACDNIAVPQAAAGNGGGLIFIRAGSITNSGSLLANAQNGLPGGRDAAGGGGGGGTVVVLTGTPNPNLIIQANGGQGGNTGYAGTGGVPTTQLYANETQGPGGGGGGGAVVLSSNITLSTAPQLNGGAGGRNFPLVDTAVNNAYGTASGGGVATTVPFVPTASSLAVNCQPQLVVTKATTTPVINAPNAGSAATYQINVRNTGTGGAAGVAITDVLPTPFTLSSTIATVTFVSAAGPSPAVANSPGSATPVIGTAGGSATDSFVILPGGSVTVTFSVSVNTTTVGVYQNTATTSFSDPYRTAAGATVSPGGTFSNGSSVSGSNYNSSSSTLEDVRLTNDALITLTKSNGVNVVLAGSTTVYSLIVANQGPANAGGTTISDPAAPGLNCTNVTCNTTSGTATCPSPLTISALQGAGLTIPTLNANSSLTFLVTCGVTATGQ